MGFHDTAIARVKSRPVPDLLYSSGNSVLIGRCAVSRSGYNVSAFTLSGSFLWRQHWDDCRFSPVARNSEDGSRFAAGTVSIRRVPKMAENESNENAEEGLVQHVHVLDTATGNSMLSITASPAVLDGQNFSLSPEGTRLAVIVGNAIELYDLPEMSSEDRARWVAVKADTPKPGEEPIYSSASDEETSEEKPPKQEAIQPADSGAPAKAPAEEPSPILVLRTGTQVVAVDVVVTDSSGHPVKGLAQKDFRVLEDGKPQNVRYFQEMAEANRPAVSVPPPQQALPPNVFSNYAASTEEEHAVTVVLLDLLNTPMTDQSYAQDQLIKFLKKKPKDAKFAICILGNRLQMIQGFTEDQATLLGEKLGMHEMPSLPSYPTDPLRGRVARS